MWSWMALALAGLVGADTEEGRRARQHELANRLGLGRILENRSLRRRIEANVVQFHLNLVDQWNLLFVLSSLDFEEHPWNDAFLTEYLSADLSRQIRVQPVDDPRHAAAGPVIAHQARVAPDLGRVFAKSDTVGPIVWAFVPWVAREVGAGRAVDLALLVGARSAHVPDLVDWYNDVSPDLLTMRAFEVRAAVDAWHAQFAQTLPQGSIAVPGVRIVDIPSLGLHIDRLLTEEQLAYEGAVLEHCVAGYGHKARQGTSLLYSLRDEAPKATAEVQGPPFQVVQVRGSQNVTVHESAFDQFLLDLTGEDVDAILEMDARRQRLIVDEEHLADLLAPDSPAMGRLTTVLARWREIRPGLTRPGEENLDAWRLRASVDLGIAFGPSRPGEPEQVVAKRQDKAHAQEALSAWNAVTGTVERLLFEIAHAAWDPYPSLARTRLYVSTMGTNDRSSDLVGWTILLLRSVAPGGGQRRLGTIGVVDDVEHAGGLLWLVTPFDQAYSTAEGTVLQCLERLRQKGERGRCSTGEVAVGPDLVAALRSSSLVMSETQMEAHLVLGREKLREWKRALHWTMPVESARAEPKAFVREAVTRGLWPKGQRIPFWVR